ncbi:hypothetical protein KPSA1B_101162 [Pseudomonas syringae pv. actinidiae]|nr:hypothetical protein KPSA1B_101162 [Pseudomonas syringae pv. actinidiae]
MMRPDAKVEKVYLYPKPVDFRKSIGRRRKKMPLQLGVGQHRRPGQAAGSKAIEVFTDAGSTYLQAGSNLAGRQADLEFET